MDPVELFAPLRPTYDRFARLLSFGQDPRWRRFLVSRLQVGPNDTVLDVATGTAAVAIELSRRTGCRVVGLDQSPEMLETGRRRIEAAGLADRIEVVEGVADRLPFEEGELRGAPGIAMPAPATSTTRKRPCASSRVGATGTIAMLEFGLPRGAAQGLGLYDPHRPAGTGEESSAPGWHRVGSFLGSSIRDFYRRYDLIELWRNAGIETSVPGNSHWAAGFVAGGILVRPDRRSTP